MQHDGKTWWPISFFNWKKKTSRTPCAYAWAKKCSDAQFYGVSVIKKTQLTSKITAHRKAASLDLKTVFSENMIANSSEWNGIPGLDTYSKWNMPKMLLLYFNYIWFYGFPGIQHYYFLKEEESLALLAKDLRSNERGVEATAELHQLLLLLGLENTMTNCEMLRIVISEYGSIPY